VKKRFELPFIVALAVLFATISWGSLAQAQQTAPDTQQPQTQQPPDTQAPPPSQTPQQPAQTPSTRSQPDPSTSAPNSSAQSDPSGSKEFVGTVVKQGDKYMFQDAASGTMYDIDHQDEVKKFEGKKVRVHGSLDASSKTIHVQ
jgi:uncharacterized protein YdeI (BOF family)